jgi:hypothetical protein
MSCFYSYSQGRFLLAFCAFGLCWDIHCRCFDKYVNLSARNVLRPSYPHLSRNDALLIGLCYG